MGFVRSHAEGSEAVTPGGAGGIADVYLTGLRVFQDNRARTDDAVLTHEDTVGDTTVHAEERATAHSGVSADRSVRAEVAVVFDHGAVPDTCPGAERDVVTQPDHVLQRGILL